LEITKKTVLSLMLVMITILITPTLTTTITAAYAGGDNDGDGNKQKAEDDSAAIADCDDNDVELARFLCIALATNDVEIELPEEEPPEEESTTLFVCKVVNDPNQEFIPFDFAMRFRSAGVDLTFPGGPIGDPDPDCPQDNTLPGEVTPGEYSVTDTPDGGVPPPDSIEVEGDCVQDPTNPQRATGEIQAGETQTCTFINTYEDGGDS
jgi:hypothetical protein